MGGVETFRDLSAIEELRRRLQDKYSFHDIISQNKEMLEIFDILPTVAESDSTVLIEGDSGTGKELVARAIHDLSPRKDRPFVAINCGALPENLLESELFGYRAGAFTGANRDKAGRFAMAEGGTVFLDEVADIPPSIQVKLLRVLQERIFEPLGSVKPVKADIRLITATNKNLEKMVKSNRYRDDLYYRINVIRLYLPPLKDRREDIPLLIEHFISRFNRIKNKNIVGIEPAALEILLRFHYPGNIRELENIIEHAVVLSRDAMIKTSDLPDHLINREEMVSGAAASFDDLETDYLKKILIKNRWHRGRTAAELGIHKTTLWRKIKKLGIIPPS
jgi:transcriptional regulator with PAS, ATPase and Fis domain